MIFLAPRLYYYYTYERSIGKVTKFYLFSSHGRKFTTHKKYPIIEFDSKEYHIKFTGPAFMSESVKQDDNVPVIYDKKNPENAYVLTFHGFWGDAFIYMLPFFLIWTICILRSDFIPKYIDITKLRGYQPS